MNKFKLTLLFITICCSAAHAQKYDLAYILAHDQLTVYPGSKTGLIKDGSKPGITCNGTFFLKGVDFREGTIEVDIRGRNSFLNSFPGIAFHAADTLHYDVVYFRPFNYKSPDTLRRHWSLQYMSIPDYPYDRLRKEHPLQFETEIHPTPDPEAWIHARIVVGRDSIKVYVNGAMEPALSVKNLGTVNTGMIGLWTSNTEADFANLVITKSR